MKIHRKFLASSLYVNYIIHGMGAIIIAQNAASLMSIWQTNLTGVATVIANIGLGRLLTQLLAGKLSDRWGRKTIVLLGMVCYAGFFGGLLISQTLLVAQLIALLAGVANACLDAGTYPSLTELFPQQTGSANVLLKACMSLGQFVLPLIVSLLVLKRLWFGWNILLCLGLISFNAIVLCFIHWPPTAHNPLTSKSKVRRQTHWSVTRLDLVLLISYGFLAQATFYLVSQWLTRFGQTVVQLTTPQAQALISYYSLGSVVCVFMTVWLTQHGVAVIKLMLVDTFLSVIAIGNLYFFNNHLVCILMAGLVGFSAAGGVMQLGLTLLLTLWPQQKGWATGLYNSAGALAAVIIPLLTGQMAHQIKQIFGLDLVIAILGFGVVMTLAWRLRQLS